MWVYKIIVYIIPKKSKKLIILLYAMVGVKRMERSIGSYRTAGELVGVSRAGSECVEEQMNLQ